MTGIDARRLHALARLLEYPGADFAARLAAAPPGDYAALAALTNDAREELFAATFDIAPSCVPYVSIHLFGEENFKRGEFMAALRARYAAAGFDSGGELPDHLAVLLRFAACVTSDEWRELTAFCLLGPLAGMLAALPAAHPYRAVLLAVERELHAVCPNVHAVPSPFEQMRTHGAGCGSCAARCEVEDEPVETR